MTRIGYGIDFHFKSDNHVITAMGNRFSTYYNEFSTFNLRYSYKF